jgi:hypothetical protein
MAGGTRALVALVLLVAVALVGWVQCNSHACSISGSSYDQSCTTSSECVVEPAGDFCICGCACGNTAINALAQKQYESDLSRALTAGCAKSCPCPFQGYPVCVHGTCGLDGSVWVAPDAGTD